MRISIIVAIGKNYQIGKDNKLLWHVSDDLKRFKKLTTGHHILMGRKTYESIGKPLPNRTSIVLTHNNDLQFPGVEIAKSLNEGIEIAKNSGETELFIIGGGTIYKDAIDIADRIYLSIMSYDGDADTYFPEIDYGQFTTVESISCDEYDFQILDRKQL